MRTANLTTLVMLTACWSGTSTNAPPLPSRAARQDTFDASTCPRDAIVETVCGAAEGARCDFRGDGLHALDVARLHVTRADDSAGTVLREFVRDESATSSYREKLVEEDELDVVQVRRRCCYSKCTTLIVGASVTSRPPLSLPTPEACIPPPPAGTSAPAPTNRDCPFGVKLDGAMRAYVHANDGLCCYDMRD